MLSAKEWAPVPSDDILGTVGLKVDDLTLVLRLYMCRQLKLTSSLTAICPSLGGVRLAKAVISSLEPE